MSFVTEITAAAPGDIISHYSAKFALETELLERDYYQHWQGLKKHFTAGEKVGR